MPMNCLECIHRRSIPGDAHSSCVHPLIELSNHSDNCRHEYAYKYNSRSGPLRCEPGDAQKLNIRTNIHGVTNGWCNWPYNFDPVWIDQCTGFSINKWDIEE